jgi:hypothetical protein
MPDWLLELWLGDGRYLLLGLALTSVLTWALLAWLDQD